MEEQIKKLAMESADNCRDRELKSNLTIRQIHQNGFIEGYKAADAINEKVRGEAKELYRALDLMAQVYWPFEKQQELTYAQNGTSNIAQNVLEHNKHLVPSKQEKKEIHKRIRERSTESLSDTDYVNPNEKRLGAATMLLEYCFNSLSVFQDREETSQLDDDTIILIKKWLDEKPV